MPRKPMVTRTFVTTKATVLCMDIKSEKPVEQVFKLPTEIKDEKKIMKMVAPMCDPEELVPVQVKNIEHEETLIGMSYDDFMKYGTILPPRTKATVDEQ